MDRLADDYTVRPLIQIIMDSGVKMSFTPRPVPVDGDLRLIWRLALLVMILSLCCRGGRSSLRKLHLLDWSTRTPAARDRLLAALEGDIRPQDIIVRTDPVLNQIVDYAAGEGLVEFPTGDRIQLTKKGTALARELVASADFMSAEKAFLRSLGKRITEERVMLIMAPAREL